MSKYFISLLFVISILFTSESYSQKYGHYKVINDTCLTAYSVVGTNQTICNCPQHKHLFIYGGLLNAVAICNADTASLTTFDYPALPYKIQPEAYVMLLSFQKFLQRYGTEQTAAMSEIIPNFVKALQDRNIEKVQSIEFEYIKMYDNLDKKTKADILDRFHDD